jgi:hypothetical protein
MNKIIKVTCPPWGPFPVGSSEIPFMRQSHGESGVWEDFQFIVNRDIESCDYWVVFDQILSEETCMCPKENTILITGEPQGPGKYPKVFLNQFSSVISNHTNLPHNNVYNYLSGHPWFSDKSYDDSIDCHNVEKTKCLSLITTKKNFDRYNFALKLKEHFGDKLDLFGIGINPIVDKWNALDPYKYTVVMENCKQRDWITEKLFEPYLSLTYPFYYGAPNILDYYKDQSFTSIDLSDIDGSITIIENILNNSNHYEQSIPYLLEAKNLTLNSYNFFPLIVNFIKKCGVDNDFGKVRITISDKGRFTKNFLMFLAKNGIYR